MLKSIVASLFAVMVLVGCNTVQGVGEDVQQAGSAIERSAS